MSRSPVVFHCPNDNTTMRVTIKADEGTKASTYILECPFCKRRELRNYGNGTCQITIIYDGKTRTYFFLSKDGKRVAVLQAKRSDQAWRILAKRNGGKTVTEMKVAFTLATSTNINSPVTFVSGVNLTWQIV